jgi:hypothetical protein
LNQNSEVEGQVKLLEEVKKRVGSEKTSDKREQSPSKISEPQIDDTDYKKSLAALADVNFDLIIR